MTSRRILLHVFLFLLALTGIRFVWILLAEPAPSPHASQGIIDLRDWDFDRNRALSLKGEWEFYPDALLFEGSLPGRLPDEDRELVRVPGQWKPYMGGEGGDTFGYGTYRLRVQVKGNPDIVYAIRMPSISASNELYVNGRLVGSSGHTASSAERYEPKSVPYSASFTSDRDEIEIVVQVANYDDLLTGGLDKPIQFGSEAAVNRKVWLSAGSQLAVCLILFMHVAYSAILYVMGIRRKSLLYFCLTVLCGIVSILIDDDRLLLTWIRIDYAIAYKMYYLVFLAIPVFLVYYVKSLLPKSVRGGWITVYSAICAVYAFVALLLPLRWLLVTDILSNLLSVAPLLILPVVAFRAVVRGDRDLLFVLLGVVIIVNNMIWGIVKNTIWPELGFYPIDLATAFIVFAVYWFKRYLRSSNRTKLLAERLLEADERKDRFLANTSHELRNPLHGIINIAQTVMDSDSLRGDANNKENMKLLISVGRRMSLLLNDLLDAGRLQENAVQLHRTGVSVKAVVSGVFGMVSFMLEGKAIRLENRIPDGFPPVSADENRLVQIMFNLLHNAVKFTNEGSITVEASAQGRQARIVVSDTGIGMDERTLRTIFEPYEQGDVAETEYGGIGLGLSISKQLAELHGGELFVRSSPGRGSEFTLTLPLLEGDGLPEEAKSEPASAIRRTPAFDDLSATEAAAAYEPPASVPVDVSRLRQPAMDNRIRILAVDDDPVNLNVLRGVLSSDGCEVVAVTSGEEALALLPGNEWDLIIADVMMPGMSGYELTRAVRRYYAVSELPVLLLTARNRPEDLEAGFRAGANDYVAKPVNALELRSRTRALSENVRSVRERMRMEAAWHQAQIQPHFLFNTLNSIATLGEIDVDRMRALLESLAQYLRASFNVWNLERLVDLRDEMDLVRSYLHIEKERFGDRLCVEWEVDERRNILVPPVSIQPLVENAVQHGVMKRSRGGTVRVRVVHRAEESEISVADDGVGMDEGKLRALLESTATAADDFGIGLRNTDRRLKQLFGQGLRIASAPGEGTTISFTVRR